jgi:hypothetical protein
MDCSSIFIEIELDTGLMHSELPFRKKLQSRFAIVVYTGNPSTWWGEAGGL